MENIGPLLGFCAFLALLAGALGLIAPSIFRVGKMKDNPSRKRIAAISGATFLPLFIVGIILTPEPSPEQRAAWAAAEAREEAERKAADQAEAREEAQALAQAKSEERAEARKVAKSKAAEQAELRGDVEKLWNQIADTEEPCSEGAKRVTSVGTSDRYRAYGTVAEARSACRIAHYAMRKLSVPGRFEDEQKDQFQTAIRKCADSNLARQMAFDAMLAVIDGDERPSALQTVKDSGELAQAAGFLCVATFISAANAAGVSIESYVKDRSSH